MKYIVIDLEMNRIAKEYKEERKICHMEVIQIGAVLLDEKFHEISSFSTLVKPQYNTVIEKTYEKLTGIKTEMVQAAPVFENALHQFFAWCHNIDDEIEIFQWSNTDHSQIEKEIMLKSYQLTDYEEKLFSKWSDFQKEYGEQLGLSDAISLKNAIMYAGIDPEGTLHNALFDARNTATLLAVVRTPELRKKALDNVINVMNPKPHGTSLGELFNFELLNITA